MKERTVKSYGIGHVYTIIASAIGNLWRMDKYGADDHCFKKHERLGHGTMPVITFRNHTTSTLTDEERADRVAHRKQIRHNRQRLINKRGYA